ncbi:MAG: hypothetical protein H8E66_02775 [Planctomycetes bacterium]|nr:hypothetical protein [Planctomycetota bacterium]
MANDRLGWVRANWLRRLVGHPDRNWGYSFLAPGTATMTSQHDKAKRWRPRFSVRTLVIVVTLVCCYAACWGPTKKSGVDDVTHVTHDGYYPSIHHHAMPVLPLVVRRDEKIWGMLYQGRSIPGLTIRRYYFWFFGYVAKLPYKREI